MESCSVVFISKLEIGKGSQIQQCFDKKIVGHDQIHGAISELERHQIEECQTTKCSGFWK